MMMMVHKFPKCNRFSRWHANAKQYSHFIEGDYTERNDLLKHLPWESKIDAKKTASIYEL